MPLNGSGSYTPPASSFPAVAGTVIEASKFNSTINDIASALSQALYRDGQAMMSGNLNMGSQRIDALLAARGVNGSAAVPVYSFINDATSGLYLDSAGRPALTANGIRILRGLLAAEGGGIEVPAINGEPYVNPSSMANRAINGDMAVDQINLGATITVPVVNPQYIIDCWCAQSSQASKFQIGQSTNAPTGFRLSLTATSLSAYAPLATDFFVSHRQNIEGIVMRGNNFGTASARQIAVSFWVFSSLTGLHAVSFVNAVANRSYVATYTVTTASTWEYKTIIVPGDVAGTWAFDNTLGLGVLFDFGSGSVYDAAAAGVWNASTKLRTAACVQHVANSGAVLRVTGFQVLVSPVAAPMIQRLLAQEFVLCQRYFQRHTSPPLRGVFSSTTGIARMGMPLPVNMRVAPLAAAGGSLTFAGPALNVFDGSSVGTISAFTVNYSGAAFVEFDCTVATGTFVAGRPAVCYAQDAGSILLSAGI